MAKEPDNLPHVDVATETTKAALSGGLGGFVKGALMTGGLMATFAILGPYVGGALGAATVGQGIGALTVASYAVLGGIFTGALDAFREGSQARNEALTFNQAVDTVKLHIHGGQAREKLLQVADAITADAEMAPEQAAPARELSPAIRAILDRGPRSIKPADIRASIEAERSDKGVTIH